MPTYEFTCRKCGLRFDVFTAISKKRDIRCPGCGSADLKESYGVFYMGGNVSKPVFSSCSGSCSTCSGTCKSH